MVEITEHELDAFRHEHLSASAVLRQLVRRVHLLLRIALGVGKSFAADELLAFLGTYKTFDLIVYAAPMWRIINERAIVAGRSMSPVRWTTLRPRPRQRCGALNPAWEDLEQRGCAAYAKATLCRRCPWFSHATSPCPWPSQFDRLEGIRLIFCAEQHLVVNRSLLPFLKDRTGAKRVLIILDEARFLDAKFEIAISIRALGRFRDAAIHSIRPNAISSSVGATWIRGIDALLAAPEGRLRDRYRFPPSFNRQAFKVQAAGIDGHGAYFRYLGYDLAQLQWARASERWKDDDGAIRFIARPYLGCHVLLLSAHLDGVYAGHRLGTGMVPSPFAGYQFRHTATTILNLKSRLGAARYFDRNKDQILDTFAMLIRRNILHGRSTLLISRKHARATCAEYLENRLAGWGLRARFVIDAHSELPARPDPTVIPIIHYGILDVNDFTEYESAYCLNGFYISTRHLNDHVQEAEPERFRVELKIASNPDMTRRVEIVDRGAKDLDHVYLGNVYLKKLELDPVVQAAGRVRFLTKPREVVFFQMTDLVAEFGQCRDVGSLAELRRALDLPVPKDVDREVEFAQIETWAAEGLTGEEIARRLGVSPRTVDRRRAEASAKSPLSNTRRSFGAEGAKTEAGGDDR